MSAPNSPLYINVDVTLTPKEIESLKAVHQWVRQDMAKCHTWDTRDAAMTALGKILTSAKR